MAHEIGKVGADADGEGILIGVDYADPVHAFRDLAQDLDSRARSALYVEPLVDDLFRELHDVFHCQGNLLRLYLGAEPASRGERGIDAVCQEDRSGAHVPFGAVGRHPDDAAAPSLNKSVTTVAYATRAPLR